MLKDMLTRSFDIESLLATNITALIPNLLQIKELLKADVCGTEAERKLLP